jgi:hypothetical protein
MMFNEVAAFRGVFHARGAGGTLLAAQPALAVPLSAGTASSAQNPEFSHGSQSSPPHRHGPSPTRPVKHEGDAGLRADPPETMEPMSVAPHVSS